MRLCRPHPLCASLHTRRRQRLALVASSPTPSLRVHPPAGQRQRLASPLHIRQRRQYPRLALTHLVCPSTHSNNGASPSRRPHLLCHTHAYSECHTNTHTLNSPSRQFAALVQHAHWLPPLPCTRAPTPSCCLTLSSQSPSGSLTHSQPLVDPRSPPVLPRPLLLFAPPRPP